MAQPAVVQTDDRTDLLEVPVFWGKVSAEPPFLCETWVGQFVLSSWQNPSRKAVTLSYYHQIQIRYSTIHHQNQKQYQPQKHQMKRTIEQHEARQLSRKWRKAVHKGEENDKKNLPELVLPRSGQPGENQKFFCPLKGKEEKISPTKCTQKLKYLKLQKVS